VIACSDFRGTYMAAGFILTNIGHDRDPEMENIIERQCRG
jgi:hypothetical protein